VLARVYTSSSPATRASQTGGLLAEASGGRLKGWAGWAGLQAG